jgi:hypothetical protein
LYSSDREYLTQEEFRTVCASLSDQDLAELTAIGNLLAVGLRSYDGADLFSTAIVRTATGERGYPRKLREEPCRYLIMTMKSIASGVRKHERVETRAGERLAQDPLLPTQDDPESILSSKEVVEAVLELFSDDPMCQRVALGLLAGERGAELRKLVGDLKYASLRKKISRRLVKYWGNQQRKWK